MHLGDWDSLSDSDLVYEFGTNKFAFVPLFQPSHPTVVTLNTAVQDYLTLLGFTMPSIDKALDTIVLYMTTIKPVSDRWLNLYVMFLFLFSCKCFHFNEIENI